MEVVKIMTSMNHASGALFQCNMYNFNNCSARVVTCTCTHMLNMCYILSILRMHHSFTLRGAVARQAFHDCKNLEREI